MCSRGKIDVEEDKKGKEIRVTTDFEGSIICSEFYPRHKLQPNRKSPKYVRQHKIDQN